MIKVGVLAVQGSFAEHIAMLERIDGRAERVGLSSTLSPAGFKFDSFDDGASLQKSSPSKRPRSADLAGLNLSQSSQSPSAPAFNDPSRPSPLSQSSNEPAPAVQDPATGADKFKGRLDIRQIRQQSDLKGGFDALIFPGGESTTMGKLLRELGLFEPLREMIKGGVGAFGTCAGAILLAGRLVGDSTVHFGLLEASVQRNAYGRQLGSFTCVSEFKGVGSVPMVFVRAPVFADVGEGVQVLSVVNERIVAVRQDNMLATSYHPELTRDERVHRYFLESLSLG
ncbi:pyridoxal 5'-phosphate synthase glutaminase subunit PdxT [Campylobacter sp. 19-13652]|uniref:pyridoxal 5'-phosphate synthase glutaminase subunit PdxT n=1 Tax=Campylobacter sp. 19-13652 TaxID=2840180 RepID=UPI001C740A7D|nr:pyridoxal 5'-phosphate synthase glutaminase subunit PdxT [Campylobacter sp. 19-13652]BCX80122.1 hypothetical protein LBC_15840 [Campylobacter sp. 19-13652]